jgi:hypothetical protein
LLVQMAALKQRLFHRPKFCRVASKNGTTEYRFRKFSVYAKTLSMMSVEGVSARRPGIRINLRGAC